MRLDRLDQRLRVIEGSTRRVETHAIWVKELYTSLYQRPLRMLVAACGGAAPEAEAILEV